MSRGQLYAETRAVSALDEAVTGAMWTLFERYYADVSREGFARDLRAKDHVFLLRERDTGALVGFSTVQSYRRAVAGRSVLVVYSGDTVCERRHWGQRALHSAFLRYVMRLKLTHPFLPLYWFLISKGYKTFLLLARNFPEHWPRFDRKTPAWQSALLDSLAREKFGSAWIPERGILHFTTPQGRLRGEVAPMRDAERADPHIRFFDTRNPGAPDGDELCCLGRVGVSLAVNYGRRRLLRAIGVGRRERSARRVDLAATPLARDA